MADSLAPSFDVERGPILVGAVVFVIGGVIGLFGFQRPGYLLAASLFAGVAAGLRGGYYSQSSTEGLVSVVAGLVLLFPALVVFRAFWLSAFPKAGDSVYEFAFLGVVGAIADVAVFGPFFLLFGYLGGSLVGRFQSGPERSIRRSENES
ncbi:hypothetical protein L593_09315 [Salinarchaeum sp. Harcht-Bsk1]|uniref:hypothetical protein n=1 Tax=Salinarchaeum sp. Harcht-Bsk1 TaxID=1333523 RepID=UPI0003424840|nr:hypothetical protein [Salinarchaeum sp. Harcht-Bsk1]AGN01808.1 hypothetical protein L593_09315 [Salinarchaeum sp. Harcht-Bsk1]